MVVGKNEPVKSCSYNDPQFVPGKSCCPVLVVVVDTVTAVILMLFIFSDR